MGLFLEFLQHLFPATKMVPYTVGIFLIGMLLGATIETDKQDEEEMDNISRALFLMENLHPVNFFLPNFWCFFNEHVFLQVFLPPLLYEGASTANFHLFRNGFYQTLILAFPGVIINTTLTGILARFCYEYDWSWSQSLLFGAIVSATVTCWENKSEDVITNGAQGPTGTYFSQDTYGSVSVRSQLFSNVQNKKA